MALPSGRGRVQWRDGAGVLHAIDNVYQPLEPHHSLPFNANLGRPPELPNHEGHYIGDVVALAPQLAWFVPPLPDALLDFVLDPARTFPCFQSGRYCWQRAGGLLPEIDVDDTRWLRWFADAADTATYRDFLTVELAGVAV